MGFEEEMSRKRPMKKYTVSGYVYNKNTGFVIPGVRVEAWDKDGTIDDLLGSCITNSKGFFIINFDESAYADDIHDLEPDIYFKVFDGEKLLLSTEKRVLWYVSTDLDMIKPFFT